MKVKDKPPNIPYHQSVIYELHVKGFTKLIMDSLRYWVTEMHVDGFRFDLAPALVRELRDANRLNAFFDIIHQDPVLSQVKLIAEPWDITQTGYLLGKFPPEWAWFLPDGNSMQEEHWKHGFAKSLGVFLHELESQNDDPLNEVVSHERFYCIFNAHHEEVEYRLPVGYCHRRNAAGKANLQVLPAHHGKGPLRHPLKKQWQDHLTITRKYIRLWNSSTIHIIPVQQSLRPGTYKRFCHWHTLWIS